MIRRLLTACTMSFCTSAIAANPAAKDLVGCWFSTGTQGQPEVAIQSINNRAEDGSFLVRFVIISAENQLAYQTEAGYWAVNGQRYLTITTSVNGETASYADVYNLLYAGKNRLSYRKIDGDGALFQSERVPCDTKLPRK